MSNKYQISEVTEYEHKVRQRCRNPELGFVVLADFHGPDSRENAEIFLKTLKEKRNE